MGKSNQQVILSAYTIWFAFFVSMNGATLAWIMKSMIQDGSPLKGWRLAYVAAVFAIMNIVALGLCISSKKAMVTIANQGKESEQFFPTNFIDYVFNGSAVIVVMFFLMWVLLAVLFA